ncbi:MAG TPA: ATP-binding protein, partial [Candidatus Saccharimonadales bacterium]|nr:ATP-binding protein [Candidatus Saccharimonadales bacterium]
QLDPIALGRVVATREPRLIPIVTDTLVDAIAKHDPGLADIMRARGLRSLLLTPMVARGEVLGVMTFLAFGIERQLGEREQALALAVAGRAAAALQNADLYAAAHAELLGRRRAEAQLLQAQKLEAVGRLAGGVAHDFNNLLMVISGCAEFLLEDCRDDDSPRQDIMEIKRAAERGAALTRQLLTFSRNQVVRPRHVGLNALVQDMEKMLQRLIGEDVSLSISLSVEPPVAFVDPGQIEQALANLAVNARDAMPRGGQLRIGTGHAMFDASDAAMRPEIVPGKYILLSVSDTGSGMDAATQARIFEPFFTTKEPGKGTGLGLATVFGIVKQAGGHIVVYSEPGIGSTFKLFLPSSADRMVGMTAPPPVASSTRGSETVLLVEDAPAVRQLAHRALVARGFTVLDAESGQHALEVIDSYAGPVHIVVTDVVLPGMNGRELVERLQALRPGISALFMSGYTADVLLHHRVTHHSAPFLEKPFTVEALIRAVREVLDQPGAGER